MSPRDLPGQAATRPTVLTVKSLILYSFVSLARDGNPQRAGAGSLWASLRPSAWPAVSPRTRHPPQARVHTRVAQPQAPRTPRTPRHIWSPGLCGSTPVPCRPLVTASGATSSVQSGHSLPGQQWVGLSPNEMSTPPAGPREAAAGLQPSVCGSRSPLSGLRFQRKVTSLPRPVTAASVRAVRWGPADGEGSSACPQPCCCSCGAAPPTPGPSG